MTTIERAGLTFVCTDPIEVWRAETILEKEPGTIAWIETFQPGDVFFDIGANIGVYSLLAAQRGAVVLAFEPHPGNAVALKTNVKANGLRVFVDEFALSNVRGTELLHLRSERVGSSGSQVGTNRDENGHAFEAARSMTVRTERIDDFQRVGSHHPSHIKIDVDGQELKILYGARDTLTRGVKSVQVETHPAQRAALLHYMNAFGYVVQSFHYTQNGQKAIDKGAKPEDVVSNTIFVREDA